MEKERTDKWEVTSLKIDKNMNLNTRTQYDCNYLAKGKQFGLQITWHLQPQLTDWLLDN